MNLGAERFAELHAAGNGVINDEQVAFALRSSGTPYVWPRTWALQGAESDEGIATRLAAWAKSFKDAGERRCGIGRYVTAAGVPVTAALASDVLADLAPIPTQIALEGWVDVAAKFVEPVTDARVIVLGPRGEPRALSTTLDGQRATARFSADQKGRWLVQVLATIPGGPRPVLAAEFYAGVPVERGFHAQPVPGERAGQQKRGRAALLAMLNAARASEKRAALKGLPALDVLAQQHADAMRLAGRLSHELEHGNAQRRLEQAEFRSRRTGENIALAESLARAHRALWASPSHRGNLLERGFRAVGIGVAEGADGRVWVTEIFADPY